MSTLSLVIPPISIKTILTCLLWYLISSITSQLTKLILVKFTYPLFLSQFQFLISTLLAFAFISIARKFPDVQQHFPLGSLPNNPSKPIFDKSILIAVLPLGIFQFTGKYFSLNATSLIPLSTVSSIKALSPLLIVAGYRVIYNVKFPFITYLSLTPLVGGVVLIIASESMNNSPGSKSTLLRNDEDEFDYKKIKGFVFCLISTIVFAAQSIYGKKLFTWNSSSTNNNPASLALNTEASKPGTPALEQNFAFSPPDNKFFDFSPKKSKKFIRQRTNSIKLPFSTSDLRLDEKNEEIGRQQLPYTRAVQNNDTITNPFASFTNDSLGDNNNKPDRMTTIFYCSMIGFFFSFGGFIVNELSSIFKELTDPVESLTNIPNQTTDFVTVLCLIFLDSLSHFSQMILAFHLLGLIPALSYSIASMMKRIVIITVSIILAIGSTQPHERDSSKWFGKINTQQLYGLILIAIGLYCYDRWGSRSLKANRI
ncbi:uncharacterized protein AC631_02043 [Debaryomyces fabryi]|uniref:Sugar phosphate transporter domain-containing protein n=1 Tax=Debaryomyces fabryi TaxID=58627 RepID=A0A0V1Q168_9ASCO|nr:uncharacterized protein AC631_02043 [Debaryomyces fabryi]KSA02225.1 hypothetical protein AC631_02043 [Debaryomyces fabryi]CUM46591.1 unnamed protein product [Debaryomyces fabryi]